MEPEASVSALMFQHPDCVYFSAAKELKTALAEAIWFIWYYCIMATYIEDEEVSELLGKYAKREGKTKTGALRDLLRRELKVRPKKSPEARFQDALVFVANNPTEKASIKEADINFLYEYLHAD